MAYNVRKRLESGFAEIGDGDNRVSIHPTNAVLAEKPSDFGVNWPAIGTTSPEKTRKFALLLLRAADLAEEMEQEIKPLRRVYVCYDCADVGMVVESSFLDEHMRHDLRTELR